MKMAKKFKTRKKRRRILWPLILLICSFSFFLSYFSHLFTTDAFIDFLLKSMLKPSNFKENTSVLDYLLNYTIGQNETVDEVYDGKISSLEYMEDPSPKENKENPVVYLYNTHQGEEYSNAGLPSHDVTPTVMMAGYKLREELNKEGIKTIMETTPLKEVLRLNGWNYASSYKASHYLLKNAYAKNPPLKYYLDIHRDSISYEASTLNYQDKNYAKILFVIGTDHDNYKENLGLAEKISTKLNERLPSISRGILKKGGKGVNGIYNQNFSNQTLLLEIGGPYNKIEEVTNTIHVLAKVLKDVIKENGD